MARIGGRNSFIAWLTGLACVVVIGALLYLALPGVPGAIGMVGDTLRAAQPATSAQPATTATSDTTTPGCRAIYGDALWAELTGEAGGDPVESTAAPTTAVAELADSLAPVPRVTCSFTSAAGRIVTTVSDVSDDAAATARTLLVAAGFSCASAGGGVDCSRTLDDTVEQDVVRGGVWVATTFWGWQPATYTARLAPQLW